MRTSCLLLLLTSACLSAPASQAAQVERAPLVAADVHQFDAERAAVQAAFVGWNFPMTDRVFSIEVYPVEPSTARELCASSACQFADGIIVTNTSGTGEGVWAMTESELIVHELVHAGFASDTHDHQEDFWRVYRWALAELRGE